MSSRTRRAETDVSKTLIPWLKGNLGASSLGALTGAAAHILECWAYSGDPELLEAFRIVVSKMVNQEFAYHAVAHLNEWSTRDRVWAEAGLPPLGRVMRCKWNRDDWSREEWERLHAEDHS